jgi:hydrophobe/amphiphile efflux-1 (HAE1) family protein
MQFTDYFIKRPVFASVISILIFVAGLYALQKMSLREFPKIESTVISVSTGYPGANASVMKSFITMPLQQKIASAEGIDYITSSSSQQSSNISVHMNLGYPPSKALTEIMAKAAEVRGVLPKESNDPVIAKSTGGATALMYVAFDSKSMSNGQITDYLRRVVQPALQTVEGVASADILGNNNFSMRIWLDPKRLTAYNLSATEVRQALTSNNIITAAGRTKGKHIALDLVVNTALHSVKQFENIVIKRENNTLIYLRDVANVELGTQSYNFSIKFNGENATFMSITNQPGSNPLTVITKTKALLPKLMSRFPPSLESKVVYDATKYIRESINEVISTIIIASLIVIAVIFLFLGSFRSTMIPVITIPLSLVGVGSLMLAMGFSMNTLTLLALVLAIGMVVDDAIVVVENIYRHIEEGMDAFNAAITGAREIASPVISMTLTLAAVYAPIGFLQGVTGSLFREFAYTLAASVIISGIVALTLSPMMCAHLLSSKMMGNKLIARIDRFFITLKSGYEKHLRNTLNFRSLTLILVAFLVALIGFMWMTSPQELAPKEDKGALFFQATAPSSTNVDFITEKMNLGEAIFKGFPQRKETFIINGMSGQNSGFGGLMLKPWSQRKLTQQQIQPLLQAKLAGIPGLQIFVFGMPAIPGGSGSAGVQFVLTTTKGYPALLAAANKLEGIAQKSGKFMYFMKSLRFDRPTANIELNKEKTGILGINTETLATSLSTFLGGNNINYFTRDGYSYEVIPQTPRMNRYNPLDIMHYFIKTGENHLVPLGSVATLKYTNEPSALSTFQQQNSVTFNGGLLPGTSEGEAIQFLIDTVGNDLPNYVSYDFAGSTRTFIQEGSSLLYAFLFALLVIYLILAAKFESFRDPLIILLSVPLAICGALIPISLGFTSINIYSEIGMVTLIGLIAKHGILIVEFANQLQMNEKLSRLDAVIQAAATRLRPVLMTTAAMVLGVLPLVVQGGPGGNARFAIGIVITCGMLFGTLFTLVVVPTMYTFLAKNHQGDVV